MLNFRMRKLLARILLPILSVWLCVLPGQAYANPLAAGSFAVLEAGAASAVGGSAVIVGPWAGASTVATAGVGAIAATGAIALAVGMYAGYMLVGTISDGFIRVPLTSDPVTSAIPAPTASAPSVIPAHTQYQDTATGVWYDDYCAAINGKYLGVQPNPPAAFNLTQVESCSPTVARTSFTATAWGISQGYGSYYYQIRYVPDVFSTRTAAASCPAGSTYSSGVCVVDNPRLLTPDSRLDYGRSGDVFSTPASDADSSQNQQASILPDGSLLIDGKTETGALRKYVITPDPSGGSSVSIYEPAVNSTGDTGTKKSVITISPSGVVSSASQVTTGEQLTSSDVSGAPVLNPAPSGSTFSPSAPASSPVQFPSDYARTGEAAQAAQSINPKLDTLHDDLSVTTPVDDPLAPPSTDIPGWGDTFSGLTAWQLPAHSSACPTPSVDLSAVLGSGSVYTFDAHCGLIADHFNAFQAAMMLVWSLMAVFIVLRA